MKKLIIGMSVLLAVGLFFAGCVLSEDDALDALARKATSNGITWTSGEGVGDHVITRLPFQSTRTNASGEKITSNSHSAKYDDIYFAWDNKQRDDGFLKIRKSFFEDYVSFVLTKKVSNTYWDYFISVEEGDVAKDGFYIFSIPKGKGYLVFDEIALGVYGTRVEKGAPCGKNINMVFLSAFTLKGQPVTEIEDNFPVVNSYVISFEKVVVDANGAAVAFADWDAFDFYLYKDGVVAYGPNKAVDGIVTFNVKENVLYELVEVINAEGFANAEVITVQPTHQLGSVTMFSRATADNGAAVVLSDHISFLESFMINGGPAHTMDNLYPAQAGAADALAYMKSLGARWVWDRPFPADIAGNEMITYAAAFDIPEGAVIDATQIFYAADNAVVLYINEKQVSESLAFEGKEISFTNATRGLVDTRDPQFDGILNYWLDPASFNVYAVNAADLEDGLNSIVFYAANADVRPDEVYNPGFVNTNHEGNPAGLIFGGVISWKVCLGVGEIAPFVNVLLPVDAPRGTGVGHCPGIVINNAHNPGYYNIINETSWFTYIDLSDLVIGETLKADLINGNNGNGSWNVTGTVWITLLDDDTLEIRSAARTKLRIQMWHDLPEKNANFKNWPEKSINSNVFIWNGYAGEQYLYVTVDRI